MLVNMALKRAPSLGAVQARFAAAREQVSPAGALPDPMVGAMYQSIGKPWQPMAPMSMFQVEVTQAIPGAGKRAARRATAEADATTRKSEIDAMRVRLAAEVRANYAQIYAIDREQVAVDEARQLVNVLVAGVTARYTSGQVDQEALVKVQLELSELDERTADLIAQREILVSTLNELTAQPVTTKLPALTTLPEATFRDIESIDRLAQQRSADLKVRRAAIAAASRRVDSAEKETRPNFLVGLGGGATVAGDPVVVLRFGMELPIWNSTKQQPMARAARHELEAAHADLRDADLQVQQVAEKLAAQWRRDTDQIRRYRDAIIPQSNLALTAARSAYSTGRADFGTLIEDFRRWLNAQVGLARREADKFSTYAQLEALVDADPLKAQ